MTDAKALMRGSAQGVQERSEGDLPPAEPADEPPLSGDEFDGQADRVDTAVPKNQEISPDDFDDLALTSETRRIIVLRPSGVIRVSSLASVLLAVLIEAGFIGGLYALWRWRPVSLPWQGISASSMTNDRATAIGGIQGASGSQRPHNIREVAKALPAIPRPPGLPDATLAARARVEQHLLTGSLLKSSVQLQPRPAIWTPVVPEPKLPTKFPRLAVLQPPAAPGWYHGHVKVRVVRGAQPAGGSAAQGADVQPVYHPQGLLKAGVAYLGQGRVRGWSHWRGSSAANTPGPVMQEWHMPMLSLKYQIKMPRPPVLRLVIGKDGGVISATVIRSSGHRSVDTASRLAMLLDKFIPQYRDGLPVRSVIELEAWDPSLGSH